MNPLFSYFFGPNSAWFWSMLQAVVICISLYIIIGQLKSQKQTNMIGLIDSMKEKYHSREFINSRKQLCEKYLENKVTFERGDELMLTFFEELEIYLKKGILDNDFAWELYSNDVEYYWPIAEPIVKEIRATREDNTFYNHFEKLHSRMIKYGKKKGANIRNFNKNQLIKFATEEIRKT